MEYKENQEYMEGNVASWAQDAYDVLSAQERRQEEELDLMDFYQQENVYGRIGQQLGDAPCNPVIRKYRITELDDEGKELRTFDKWELER